MKRSMIVGVGVLLTMTMAWAAFGQAGGGGGGRGRGGFGMMGGEAQQKAVADLQEQVAKLKALVDAGAKAGSYQDMSEEDRAKMKERRTEQQKIVAAIQADVDRLRMFQVAAEYNQSMAALKDAQASAQKENAKETAQKLGQIIAERQRQMEEKVTAMGMTMDQVEKMGTRGGGRRGQQ